MWERVGKAIASTSLKLKDLTMATETNDDFFFLAVENDNTSYRCPSACTSANHYNYCSTNSDSDNNILPKILRWIKLIVLKFAKSYYALPVLLVALPVLVGLLVGFWCGRRYEQAKLLQQLPKKQKMGGSQGSHLASLFSFAWNTIVAHGRDDGDELRKPAFSPREQQEIFPETRQQLEVREGLVRQELASDRETNQESGVPVQQVPRHIAVIMDGNRRYGKAVYGQATAGHWDGSRKVLDFAKWCIAEKVQVLTVYAFSTENWRRDPVEVASLMSLFVQYCEELRVESLRRNIRVRVLSTETARIPMAVKVGLQKLEHDTQHCAGGLQMNICLSYGSRGEIVNACRDLAVDCVAGNLKPEQITEDTFQKRLLTEHCGDVDVLIRTSGEIRISNYLLWQLAYSEMFFLSKNWPELEKYDLLEVIRNYAKGRNRRYGK